MRVFATRHKRCQKCLTAHFAGAIILQYIVYQCLFCLIKLVYQDFVVQNVLGYNLQSAKGAPRFRRPKGLYMG